MTTDNAGPVARKIISLTSTQTIPVQFGSPTERERERERNVIIEASTQGDKCSLHQGKPSSPGEDTSTDKSLKKEVTKTSLVIGEQRSVQNNGVPVADVQLDSYPGARYQDSICVLMVRDFTTGCMSPTNIIIDLG